MTNLPITNNNTFSLRKELAEKVQRIGIEKK